MRITMISLMIAVVLGVLLGAVMGFAPKDNVKCVNIYYDQTGRLETVQAKHYVSELKKLLQAFPQYAVHDSPVNEYQSGDIDVCAASIYIGSAFENQLPMTFLNDFAAAKTNVAWLGENIWQLGSSLEEIFGFRFVSVFHEAHVQVELVQSYDGRAKVLTEVKRPGTREMLPYILQSHNHFYISDVPLAHAVNSYRYNAFTQMLGDILSSRHTREKRLGKRQVGLMWDDLMKVEF